MLKSSHLQGMERPVRSFRSFIRAIPPRTHPDKPLPPTPSEPSLRKKSSSSSLTTVHTRSTRLSLWEAPPSWDNDESGQDQSAPPFALRQYSLLIPEPPEDIAAMQADPVLWQQGHGPFHQTPLDPIRERNAATPELPPRNPSRLSVSLSNPATTRKNSRDNLPSVSSRYSTGTFEDGTMTGSVEPPPVISSVEDSPSPLDLVSALTDMSMNQKAFSSVGQGSARDQGILWDRQHQRSDSAQHEDEAHLDMQNDTLTTYRKGAVQPENDSDIADDLGLTDKMQALIFAQDYHNALAHPSSAEHDTSHRTPLHDQNLAPQPLSWKKETGGLPPSETPQRPGLLPVSSSGRHRNLKMMSSWVNQRLTGFNQRSVSDPGSTPQPQIPESEVDRHMRNEARLANMVQHSKEFVTRRILRRETEPARSMLISRPIPQPSAPVHTNPATTATPFELATPVLRLPGGLAIVRQSPSSSLLRPQTTTDAPSSPFSDLSWPDFAVSSPFQRSFSRRNSVQSTHSQPADEPPRTFYQPTSSPLASPAAIPSFSHSTASLPTQATQDTPSPLSPYTPLPLRRRSHNIGSPLSASPSSHGAHESLEAVVHKLNFFEKARHAHGSWKRHQREVRNERLKQSIRLVGPADASDVAGYIKCAVDGRVSGDSGVGEGKLSG